MSADAMLAGGSPIDATRERKVVLKVRGLVKEFPRFSGAFRKDEVLRAVSDIDLDVFEGEILCLLGESGCGKTTLARMIMHLVTPTSGTIWLDGTQIQDLSERRFRKMRRGIQMVYQNPFDCLDPSRSVSSLLQEPLKLWYPGMSREERMGRITGMLSECGLDADCLAKRPTEFSGGQLQRLSIVRALLVRPKVLIADEIVSALDVPIQNQILQLLVKMKEEHGVSVLFITHDLSVARKVSDRVMVMRLGEKVALGQTHDVLGNPEDPYVRKLADAAFSFQGDGGEPDACS